MATDARLYCQAIVEVMRPILVVSGEELEPVFFGNSGRANIGMLSAGTNAA